MMGISESFPITTAAWKRLRLNVGISFALYRYSRYAKMLGAAQAKATRARTGLDAMLDRVMIMENDRGAPLAQPDVDPDDPSLFAKILYWLAATIITVACAYFIIVLSWAAFWLITLFVPWWVMAGIIGVSIIGYAGAMAFLHAVGDH